jgi:hypothetical protein
LKASLFDTFKLTNQLTGKAKRQRKIIKIIGSTNVPNKKTKVEISRKISIENKQSWKNSYSGVYEDVEKILLPQKIIEEEGRIPLNKLTKTGAFLLFCTEENGSQINFTEFTDQKELGEELNSLYKISPTLCFLLLEKYASMLCTFGEDVIPITLEKIGKIAETELSCNLEFIKSMLLCSKEDQRKIVKILSQIDSKH